MTAEAADGPLGLIAGAGALPRLIAETRAATGAPTHVFALNEDAMGDLAAFGPVRVSWARPGEIEKRLKEAGCTAVTLAGQVTRPDFKALRPDGKGVVLIPKVVAAARKGDAALLNLLIAEFEKAGLAVLGAHDLLREAAAPAGRVAGPAPDAQAHSDLKKAAALLEAMGPFDVGQACVVCEGLVLGVEAAEGTDALLGRIAGLPEVVRGRPGARRGVLWKAPKNVQDLRADMPVIGAETVRRAGAAGLAGVGFLADRTLLLEREAAAAEAKRLGLFLAGFTASSLAAVDGDDAAWERAV